MLLLVVKPRSVTDAWLKVLEKEEICLNTYLPIAKANVSETAKAEMYTEKDMCLLCG